MNKMAALLCAMLLCMPSGWGRSVQQGQDQPAEAQDLAASVPQNVPEADIPEDVPELIGLPAGTHVPMTIVRAPRESEAREGATVYLRTRSPLRADAHVVIPARTLVVGVLSNASFFGMGAGQGLTALRLEMMILPNHYRVPISGRVTGTFGASKLPARAPSPANPVAGLTPEQLAAVGGFALVGGEIGFALGKNQKGSMVGALVGAGIGVATVLAMNSARLHLRAGTNVDAVLDEPLTLDPRYVP